ncbi:MAG: hypothetical protein GXO61_05015 [Epsilonproteobacteria bacterium]|nr:hypothetical protein [Campylobacterota bacterium]
METLFKASLHTHTLVNLLLILSQVAFFWIKKEEDFITFSKRARTLYLIQSILLGMVIFTGTLMITALLNLGYKEVWSLKVLLMIFLSIGVLVHQILLYKKLRPIRSDEIEAQKAYKSWASKVLGTEVVAEILVFILAFVLK